MTRIQVLGTGCPTCIKLTEQVHAAAKALGIEYQVEKVVDIDQILSWGVLRTPALVVDGQVKAAGRVPSVEEIVKLLAEESSS